MTGFSAKLTREHDVLGSPHYMAPEQLRATRDADTPADVWALGAVLHELLTGQTPFRGETMPELCTTVLTQPPPRLSSLRSNIPAEIEAAVLRCLEKEPTARFANLAELAAAIAPFGTAAARESCTRIERVLEGSARTSDLSLPPMPVETQADLAEHWPSDAYAVPRRGVASLQSILGALLLLSGLGAAVLMWMYDSVHSAEPVRRGVTAAQPTSRASPSPSSASAEAATATPGAPAQAQTLAEPPPSVSASAQAQATPILSATGAARAHPQAPLHAHVPSGPASTAPLPRGKRTTPTAPSSAPTPRTEAAPAPPTPAAPASDDLFTGRK